MFECLFGKRQIERAPPETNPDVEGYVVVSKESCPYTGAILYKYRYYITWVRGFSVGGVLSESSYITKAEYMNFIKTYGGDMSHKLDLDAFVFDGGNHD